MSDAGNDSGLSQPDSPDPTPEPSPPHGGSSQPDPSDLVVRYSDVQFQHMRHNAVITVGDKNLSEMLDAFEAIRQLPEEQQYEKFTEFNVWVEAQKAKADTLTEMAMVLILKDNLHIKANVSTKQMKIDNEEVLTRVEKTREHRQKAINKIKQYWGLSRKGMSFATILIMSYGTKFQNVLSKLARSAPPDQVLEVANGELIRRLTAPPKAGVRVNRHLMPSEFKIAIKVLDNKLPETAFQWNDQQRRDLGLRFNMVGMLGEASVDYSEDVPPVGDSVIELLDVPSPPPNEEVLANLERWQRLGMIVTEVDDEPREGCLMDQIVSRQGVIPPENEDENADVTQPKACKCDEGTLEDKDWFLALKEKYIAKQIGWMAMVTLVDRRPEGICGYHLHQLASALGLKTAHIARDDLVNRLEFLSKHRARIDDIRIKGKYFAWFKGSELASAERKKKLLGVLKFRPISRSASKPIIPQNPAAGLTNAHKFGAFRPDKEKALHISSPSFRPLLQQSV
ncbi:uncharacterized protein EAF01_001963 [Botrytis porri]|uniref:uncharacterized protein n=1 Tax=Botrytis porri TaxID=87229 RepID=UPI0018FF9C61|nr:uncharacterized protein EAF01_001963 [Botrytis porri]KAF7912942.1 hypothetical protein EAF01_001963 [Botrytis porri]